VATDKLSEPAIRKAKPAEKPVKLAEAARLAEAGLPGPGTFERVAREWLANVHQAKVSAGHSERTRIRLEQDIFPWIGRRPIGEVDAPELLTRDDGEVGRLSRPASRWRTGHSDQDGVNSHWAAWRHWPMM
jgi:hypothetical protein